MKLCRALCQFLWQTGLDRSSCILHDLDAIAKASPGDVPLQLGPTQQARRTSSVPWGAECMVLHTWSGDK